jgi:group I intron endonuclease
MMGVYEIYCCKSGKRYIGSSQDIEKRWQSHLSNLQQRKHHNYYLQQAYIRYGEDNFKFKVLEEVFDKSVLFDIEEAYIKKYPFNRLFNALRKPGAVPRRQGRWSQFVAREKPAKYKMMMWEE